MPVTKQHNQEPPDIMFVENANVQQPRPHHELLLRSRPYRGEPPTVAGFLLYPDTPAKMETTSREAFRFRAFAKQDRGKGDQNKQQQLQSPHHVGQTAGGKSNRDPEEDEQEEKHDQRGSTAVRNEDPADMRSQYQKDFPPPSSCRRRRTPALPQPDNIGINPAFRIEFGTVQRQTLPEWAVMIRSLRVDSPETSDH
ncbi:uncharacterized protein si:dkeyp-69c1.9 [Betta splendens]|uniref:Uncharacterized protein si:dkeyp-69c1.9 n=1 Tax=Betta splendens TaxID=158456 RepID=A0A8M1HMH5_BETSP|nr:uncharacterized protein si:dkeyp-69c1.9 [Betta splendens]XP_040929694.1 uncharacterized protein si:dkeyp-69c1.9 [Betta splendens]XP_055370652.1 uncharacterized protein si:dkeyp-69c1.9 [Betta splendens]